MRSRGAPRPVWICGIVLLGCAAPHFVHATIPEPDDRGAAAAVESRAGRTDAVLLHRARLYFERDDATFATIVPSPSDLDVRLERQYFQESGKPVLVLTAVEQTSDAPVIMFRWVRYRRVVGSGKVEVERREENAPAAAAESLPSTRPWGRIRIYTLLEAARAFPRDG